MYICTQELQGFSKWSMMFTFSDHQEFFSHIEQYQWNISTLPAAISPQCTIQIPPFFRCKSLQSIVTAHTSLYPQSTNVTQEVQVKQFYNLRAPEVQSHGVTRS